MCSEPDVKGDLGINLFRDLVDDLGRHGLVDLEDGNRSFAFGIMRIAHVIDVDPRLGHGGADLPEYTRTVLIGEDDRMPFRLE